MNKHSHDPLSLKGLKPFSRTRATWHERWVLIVIHLLSVVDALVYLGSATLISSELRAKALFDWLAEDF